MMTLSRGVSTRDFISMNLENPVLTSIFESVREIPLRFFIYIFHVFFPHWSCAPPLTMEYNYYWKFTKGVKAICLDWIGNTFCRERPLLILSFSAQKSDAVIKVSFSLTQLTLSHYLLAANKNNVKIIKVYILDHYVLSLRDNVSHNYIGAQAWHD